MEHVKYQPEHNPEAIISYCSHGIKSGRSNNPVVKDMILKAKKHLSSIGWSFFYTYKINPDRRELRYRSPAGRSYCSLRTACLSLLDQQGQYIHVLENPKQPQTTKMDNKDCSSLCDVNRPKKKIRMEDVECLYLQQQRDQSVVNNIVEDMKIESTRVQDFESLMKSCSSNVEKLNEDDDSFSNNINRPKKKIRMEDVENSYFQQQKDPGMIENKRIEGSDQGLRVQELKRLMKFGAKKNDLKPKKVIRKVESLSSTRGRRCVLSLLIDKNIVSRGARVSYCKKDGRILAKGRVYDEGIQCDCCDELFLLSKFEAHAGSTFRRPAANIFLEDGRSILDCQTQLQRENKVVYKSLTKSTDGLLLNDDFCSFCNDGGELVLCDSCTSSYHSTCIGLTQIPDSAYWFCPSCCCRICHQGQVSDFATEGNDFDDDQLKCGQCERQFHIYCVKRLGFSLSKTNSDRNKWLCSENCERLYCKLKSFSRERVMLDDNLSWRLLKLDTDENNKHECIDTYSKLNVALDVMHECFQPVKHCWSDNDLVEDLIFSRCSKRLNFKGFYTAVLERDDEMITVATLRIHGCKVAEIPLIATRFRYRRLGMCRVLIDEIERKMRELGVERLVLPAVPEMISTWTGSFGFKVMTELERMDLVEYKLLDFPGTTKCHKMLKGE